MNNVVITPLGSISPYPKSNLNCPSFLIEYNNQKFLLDCGNGSTRLLNLPNDLINLHTFISHYHFDHYGDISSLQYAAYVHHNLGDIENPINIYLPENDYKCRKQSIIMNDECYATYKDINSNKEYNIGGMNVSFYNNSHTIETYVIKLENEYFKIIYTSDLGTTNLDELISFCKNANLIICESSFLRKHNSKSKTHLTAYDAANIARLADAKKLMLTHFWPSENKMLYFEEAKEVFDDVLIAEEAKSLILRRN